VLQAVEEPSSAIRLSRHDQFFRRLGDDLVSFTILSRPRAGDAISCRQLRAHQEGHFMLKKDYRMLLGRGGAAAILAGALALAVAPPAHAADCSSLMNPVYVAGSSAVKPFLAKVAAELGKLSTPITVVYQSQGSCVGVNYFTSDSPAKLTGTGVIFDANGADVAGGCTLSDNTVDIGVSDVYATSCPDVSSLPNGVKDFLGPVQAMTFVVPMSSSQNIISAEAAYLVYGFGNDSEVSPWNDETKIEQRSQTSGTQQMIAAAIGVPAAKWKGHANSGSGDVLTSLDASAAGGAADKAIGILATDVADKNRSKVKVLGYQHYEQSCAYWPDSTANGFDKANVRDGHYPIWGPLHMLAKTANDEITNANAKKVVDALSGANVPEGLDLIALEAKSGVVPLCAMNVTRTKDGGELASFQPEKACGCKFEKDATGATPDGCKSCEKDADCSGSTPVCNYNFCEAK
jgi:ABC-type phosphate transport system substrate-binding protein